MNSFGKKEAIIQTKHRKFPQCVQKVQDLLSK